MQGPATRSATTVTELAATLAPGAKDRDGRPVGWWSWRESNPRPRASNQVFSGCSL